MVLPSILLKIDPSFAYKSGGKMGLGKPDSVPWLLLLVRIQAFDFLLFPPSRPGIFKPCSPSKKAGDRLDAFM